MTTRVQLLKEYQELNEVSHSTVDGPPTPLEFMRMIHISRPVLFQNCPLPLRQEWTDEYLATTVGEMDVSVTPDGRADALVDVNDKTYFAEPFVERMSMKDFLERLDAEGHTNEILYLQSQNDNLRDGSESGTGDFKSIRADVPSDIHWASAALGRQPDAVNIWIGSDKSVTSVHSDPYENIYAVVRGAKVFTLFPPTEGWCLEEREYPHARWLRESNGNLCLQPTPEQTVRWSSIRDPTLPVPLTRPLTILVRHGEMLYLPAGWWHYVQQVSHRTVAVNYWYDLDYQGHNWLFLNYLRNIKSFT